MKLDDIEFGKRCIIEGHIYQRVEASRWDAESAYPYPIVFVLNCSTWNVTFFPADLEVTEYEPKHIGTWVVVKGDELTKYGNNGINSEVPFPPDDNSAKNTASFLISMAKEKGIDISVYFFKIFSDGQMKMVKA